MSFEVVCAARGRGNEINGNNAQMSVIMGNETLMVGRLSMTEQRIALKLSWLKRGLGVTHFESRSFTSFRMTIPRKRHSERAAKNLLYSRCCNVCDQGLNDLRRVVLDRKVSALYGRVSYREDLIRKARPLNNIRWKRGAELSANFRDFSIVGTSVSRVDGVDKVTGKAKYAGDLIIPGMIEGKFLRSPYAHARIRAINTREAEALPGVVAVLT